MAEDNEFSYSQMMTERWEELTGNRPEQPLELKRQTLDRLRETYDDEDELRDYLYDSVSAWIWSHRGEEPKRFYINSSLTSDSNFNRVNAYREKGNGGKLSVGMLMGGEVTINEIDWLFYLSQGEVPDFEIFNPCPAWVAISQVYGRKLDDVPQLYERRWVIGNMPFEKAYKESLAKLRDARQAKAFLGHFAYAFDEAMMMTLIGAGLAVRGTTDNGPEVSFKTPEIADLLTIRNLRKRDFAYVDALGIASDFLEQPIKPAEETWDSTGDESGDSGRSQRIDKAKRAIGLLKQLNPMVVDNHEED